MIRRSEAEEKLRTLSEHQAKLFQLLLEKKRAQRSRQQIITRYPREKAAKVRVRTSGAQQRLWFIEQLENSNAAYNIPIAVRLYGNLDRRALQAALETVVQRHEILRTVLTQVDGEPVQEIEPTAPFALVHVDLSELDPTAQSAAVDRQLREESTTRFDLSSGPLIRGRLLRLREAEHVLAITMHHIVSDGWSVGVLLRELTALYSAYREGKRDTLPPLPIQYADYAQWQRERLARGEFEEQLNYWVAHLRGAPGLLELPTDRPRPATQSFRGGSV
ncbi:hypothetical protein JM946_29835, partial [Steroidobacter sp. S1-65]